MQVYSKPKAQEAKMTFKNKKVNKAYKRLDKIVKEKDIDVMKLFKKKGKICPLCKIECSNAMWHYGLKVCRKCSGKICYRKKREQVLVKEIISYKILNGKDKTIKFLNTISQLMR